MPAPRRRGAASLCWQAGLRPPIPRKKMGRTRRRLAASGLPGKGIFGFLKSKWPARAISVTEIAENSVYMVAPARHGPRGIAEPPLGGESDPSLYIGANRFRLNRLRESSQLRSTSMPARAASCSISAGEYLKAFSM